MYTIGRRKREEERDEVFAAPEPLVTDGKTLEPTLWPDQSQSEEMHGSAHLTKVMESLRLSKRSEFCRVLLYR